MAKNMNNTNAIAQGLFTNYINSDKAAEQAASSLREAICAIVINNTSVKTRVDEEFFRHLLMDAEKFVSKKSIKLYKDDKYVRTYTFIGNPRQILTELQRFFKEVVIEYGCFYEDIISYEDSEGFCWEYDGMKIAIV
jgi:hypothetical protein